MGACCGGMKNSHQHKSLPEKNKAAAAAASNANNDQQQQHGNDVTSPAQAADNGKPAGCDDDNRQQSGQSEHDAQFEAAITTLAESLESSPPPVAIQETAAAENHALPVEQEPLRIEEESKVEVAADANVFAEPPAPPPGDVLPEPAAVDEATSGDDAGFEIVSEETVQLRISEDGDLEKLAVVAEVQQAPATSQEEAQGPTDEQPIAAAAAAVVAAAAGETSADVSGTTEPEHTQVELKLSEELSPPVEGQLEVSSDVRVADVTAEVLTESSAVPVDNSPAEVIHATEVISLESVQQPDSTPLQDHTAADDSNVQLESNAIVPSEEVSKPTDEPIAEKQPEIVVVTSDEVPVQPPEIPVIEVKHELPVLESEPVAPATHDQPDNSQQITLPEGGNYLVKSEVEPANEDQSAVSASSEVESPALAAESAVVESEITRSDDVIVTDQQEVIPEQVEPSSTLAEDLNKSQEQESAPVEQTDLVEVQESSAQPSQEQPAVHDITEQQQQELQPSEQPSATEAAAAAAVDENNAPASEVKPEQVEISTVTTDQQISAFEESPKADEPEPPAEPVSVSTSEQVDSAVAVEAPETVAELPPQEPVAEQQQPVEVVTAPEAAEGGVNSAASDLVQSDQAPSSDLGTPATAADDEVQSESQHADPTATIVTDSGDLPPPEPELLSSPSEAADNIESFPLPPPPPSEDSSELGHPATATAVDDSAAATSETAMVNGAASVSPSEESTASSSTSGLSDESATAALKAAAAVDLIAVDGQHSSMEAAVASEA